MEKAPVYRQQFQALLVPHKVIRHIHPDIISLEWLNAVTVQGKVIFTGLELVPEIIKFHPGAIPELSRIGPGILNQASCMDIRERLLLQAGRAIERIKSI